MRELSFHPGRGAGEPYAQLLRLIEPVVKAGHVPWRAGGRPTQALSWGGSLGDFSICAPLDAAAITRYKRENYFEWYEQFCLLFSSVKASPRRELGCASLRHSHLRAFRESPCTAVGVEV